MVDDEKQKNKEVISFHLRGRSRLFGITVSDVENELKKLEQGEETNPEVLMGAYDILVNCRKCRILSKKNGWMGCPGGDCLLKRLGLAQTKATAEGQEYNKQLGELLHGLSSFGLGIGFGAAEVHSKQGDMKERVQELEEKNNELEMTEFERQLMKSARKEKLRQRIPKYEEWLSTSESERVSKSKLAKECGISYQQLVDDFKKLGYPLEKREKKKKDWFQFDS